MPVDTAAVPNSAGNLMMELDEQENPFSMDPAYLSATYEDMQLSSFSTYCELDMEDRPPSTPLGSEESNSHEQNMAILDHYLPAPVESAKPSHGVVFDELRQNDKDEKRKENNRKSAKRSRDRQKQERLDISQRNTELQEERACLIQGIKQAKVSIHVLETILSAIVLCQKEEDVDNDIHVHDPALSEKEEGQFHQTQKDELQVILDDLVKISPGLSLRPLDPGEHEEVKKLSEELQREAPPNFYSYFRAKSTLSDTSLMIPSGSRYLYNSVSAARLTVDENVSLHQYGKTSGRYVSETSSVVTNNASAPGNTNSVHEYGTMKESLCITDASYNEDDSDPMNSQF